VLIVVHVAPLSVLRLITEWVRTPVSLMLYITSRLPRLVVSALAASRMMRG
jgi:hypothetical protein